MKAFLGHSFAEKDNDLVEKFKKFLKSLCDDVVSGEQAESKSIASKVKSKIDECEIFVGLFTADKPVFEKKKILFGFSKFDVNSYTTSNWVLQELGYAVGKNKHVIVITEKKLHRFPNLHSDDTHVIEFNRDSLELAFQGISEMIKSIEKENKKDQFTIGIQSQDELQPLDKISEIKSEKEKDNASDQETMIFLDMIIALDSKEYSKARDVYEKKFVPTLEKDQINGWHALFLRLLYEAGDATAFSELEALASKNTDDPEIQVELGTAYKAVGGYKQAEKKYLETCSLYSLDSKKSKEGYIKCKNLLALNYLAEGNYEKSISILIEDFNKTQFKEHQDEISKNIANICHKNNDFDKFILFAEIHLDINPKDTDLRFKIAYEYDKKECNALSLLHYQRLLILTNGATALNNLGVSYWKLDMEGKSFESMRKAANAKSTLAMANIADKYVSIGAIEDAKKEINDAHKLAADKIEISSNIGQSIQLIDKKIEKENKLEKEVLENAESERRFRVENALNSMREIAPISFAGQWKTVWGNVAIESSLGKIAIDGFPKVLDYELRGKIQDNVFMKIKGEGTILGATAKLKIIVKEVFKYESDIPNSEYEEFEGEILLTLIDETNIKILRKEGGNTITEIWQKNV